MAYSGKGILLKVREDESASLPSVGEWARVDKEQKRVPTDTGSPIPLNPHV